MKKILSLILGIVLFLTSVGLVFAYGDGNYRKGKYLFRKNCRACHTEAGQAKELSPLSKTMAEWEQAFKPETAAGYPCKDEWAKLSESDLNDIYTYLYKHAADSATPAKCK